MPRGVNHGWSKTPTYKSWQSMVSRCHLPTFPGYSDYGGRGIIVCERWRCFMNFLADMGERPSLDYSIDRMDNSKGYDLSNCRWATRAEQALNRTTTETYLYNGRQMLLREIAAETGMSFDALRWRVKKIGMSIDDALVLPVQKGTRFSREIPLRVLEYDGKMMTVRQIAEATGVKYNSLRARLGAGEPLETALR